MAAAKPRAKKAAPLAAAGAQDLRAAIRGAAADLWRNLRHEVVQVPEWDQSVLLRGLTLAEWQEYGRISAELIAVAGGGADAPPSKPWHKFGDRALYAHVLMCGMHTPDREPVYPAANDAERLANMAEVAGAYSKVHDRLTSQIYDLSGAATGSKDAAAPDPVDTAGNA